MSRKYSYWFRNMRKIEHTHEYKVHFIYCGFVCTFIDIVCIFFFNLMVLLQNLPWKRTGNWVKITCHHIICGKRKCAFVCMLVHSIAYYCFKCMSQIVIIGKLEQKRFAFCKWKKIHNENNIHTKETKKKIRDREMQFYKRCFVIVKQIILTMYKTQIRSQKYGL